ncbi:hypothetical protein Tco_0716619, partial [Tanacetum coccineum]
LADNCTGLQGFLVFQRSCEVKVKVADRAIFDIAKVKVRVSDGTSHETSRRISEADFEAGPDENLKDITLKILQNKVATLPITHSTSNNGSYPQLLYLASLSEIL